MQKLLAIIVGERPMFQNTLTNDFVPFCNDNTGTNLPTQSAYIANPNLPIGNQPGIASSSFNNKALRQGTTIAAVMAQVVANATNTNVNDAQNSNDLTINATLLGQFLATLSFMKPIQTVHTSSSGTHNLTYKFQILSPTIAPTSGATYTNNGVTYTCTLTVTGLLFVATGSGAPTSSGTLTKTSGTGDATLTFVAVRAPTYLEVICIGDGGAGGSCANGTGSAAGGGGGGGGGSYVLIRAIDASYASTYAWTVGQGGAAAAVGNLAGGSGTGSTFGSAFISSTGGTGGGGGAAVTSGTLSGSPGGGGSGTGGALGVPGAPGDYGRAYGTSGTTNSTGGVGGSAAFGYGCGGISPNGNATGNAGVGYGGGGSGGCQLNNGSARAGANGAPGIIIVTEYFD